MSNQKIGNLAFTQYDGVYVDSVNGDFLNLDKLIAGTIAGGPFVIGEPVVAAPSGATGNVLAQTAGSITIGNIVGVFTLADTITAAGSGASIGTLTSITAAGGATGTPNNPVNNLTDAFTVAGNWKVSKIYCQGYLDLNNNATGFQFIGNGDLWFDTGGITVTSNIDLDGVCFRDIAFTTDPGLTITGAFTFINCEPSSESPFTGLIKDSAITTFLTPGSVMILNSGFDITDIDCVSVLGINAYNVSGEINIVNLTFGALLFQGNGLKLTIDSSCTGGTIDIYGDCKIINNSGGTTVNDYTAQTETAWKSVDGVHVDTEFGTTLASHGWSAGISPIGLPTNPVKSVADALLICNARNLWKIYFISALGTIIPSDLPGATPYALEFIGVNPDLSKIDLNGKRVQDTTFRNCELMGTNLSSGTKLWAYDCTILDIYTAGYFERCTIGPNVTFTNLQTCVFVDCSWGTYNLAYIAQDGPNDCYLINNHGRLQLERVTGAPGNVGKIEAYGGGLLLDFHVRDTVGTANLYGDVKWTTPAGLTINDYTNKPKPEVPVNITAIAASETNFLNLAVADFHYTIDDLVLKSADPGANTVNVKLYKLVNGALVNTKIFAITTANYATYYDINTMFGLKSLAGDNIKITVQATGGGPYAVTGSYAARSA